jgi:hypothetical protein
MCGDHGKKSSDLLKKLLLRKTTCFVWLILRRNFPLGSCIACGIKSVATTSVPLAFNKTIGISVKETVTRMATRDTVLPDAWFFFSLCVPDSPHELRRRSRLPPAGRGRLVRGRESVGVVAGVL